MQSQDAGLAYLRCNGRNRISAPARPRQWLWTAVRMLVLAGLVAGCASRTPVESNLPPPPGLAIIEGSYGFDLFSTSITAIETVDDRPAAAFMCGRELQESGFWTGQKYGDWWCLTPTDESAQAAQSDPVAPLVGVDPGPHKIVVVRDVVSRVPCGLGSCPSNPPGFVHRAELTMTAETGHKYQVLSESSGDRYFTWVVDEASDKVVGGQPPPQ